MVLTNDEGVDLSLRQCEGAWRLMCGGAPGYDAAAADGIQYVFSGVPIAFFNVALVTGRGLSSDALKASGDRACAWAAPKGVPWLFIMTHEALQPGVDAPAVLDQCGLTTMMPLTAMLAQQVAPAARIPHDLELTVPQDDGACAAILDVNSVAYAMDLEAGKNLIGKRSFWTDHVPVLGQTGGQPACCAAVLMVDGYRYVALVATDPLQQRRGYAEAAMRHALALAAQKHGERPSVLHATEAGRPIYERMGYDTIARHTVFMEKRFLSGH
jgi:GNAT superfamily N-acetyltransferase